MNPKQLGKREVDALLKRAFPDDLSPEQEQFLKQEARVAWARARSFASPGEYGWAWGFKRVPLAAASLAMLIVGSAMQMANRPNLMANSFSGLQTSSAVLHSLQSARGMVCRLDAADSQGNHLRYEVEWHAAGTTRVRRNSVEGTTTRTLSLTAPVIIFVGPAAGEGDPQIEALRRDPVLEPVLDFLSPSTLANLLRGRWEEKPNPTSEKPDRAIYLVRASPESEPLTLTFDLQNYHPIEVEIPTDASRTLSGVEEGSVRVRFHWEAAQSPGPILFRQTNEPRQGG